MQKYTINQKISNSGSIHDLASDMFDREIEFRAGTKYAVVLAAYYGGKGYTTHATEAAALKRSREEADYSHKIIDVDGNCYDVCGDELRMNGETVA